MSLTRLCRSCMKEVASWEVENFDQRAVEMFTFCTNIEVSDEEKLPKQFCYDCTIKIESSFTFIKKAQEVNITLKNLVSRTLNSIIVEPDTLSRNLADDAAFDIHFDNKLNIEIDNFSENTSYKDLDANSNGSNNLLSDSKNETQENTTSCQPMRKCMKKQDSPKIGRSTKEKRIDDSGNKTNSYPRPMRKCANKEDRSKIGRSTKEKRIDNNSRTETETKLKKVCPTCNRVFISEIWLNKHITNIHSNQYTTTDIDATNTTVQEGQSENETKYGQEKDINTCLKCSRSFTSKMWFSKHMETEHMENKEFLCSYCPKTFPTYHRLVYHVDSHPEGRKHGCDTCGKRFRKRKQLAAHSVCHGVARPFACHKCDMAFKLKSVLVGHLKLHKGERPHLCHVCGDSFIIAANLEAHMRRHTGARPFACEQCSYRSAYRCNLLKHARRHRSERCHICAHCGKAFSEADVLRRHLRIHTGDRPFQCPHCPLAFIDSWKRKMHMMRVHQLALDQIPKLGRDGLVK